MKTEFLTPVGRLVQGDPFEAQTKNMQGQPLMTMSGQPTQRYFVAVAFAKTDPLFGELWAKIEQVGKASFPGLNLLPPWDPSCRFSWKVIDGDGIDDNGKPNANKEGFAGHWVVKFSSSFAPRCFHAGHYQPHEQIQDAKLIKRGDYVRIAGTIEGNGNVQKPGLYVNLGMLELAGTGVAITSGPDAAAVFGGAPLGQLPPGASPLPMHAAAAALPVVAATPPLPGQMPGATLPAALPTLPVTPNPAILGNAPAPVAPATLPAVGALPVQGLPGLAGVVPGAMTSPSEPALTATGAASGMTYKQLVGMGYSDAQLRQAGYIV